MIETLELSSRPMLYVVTCVSDRASSISSTIKTSLDQVRQLMDERGIAAAGDPLAVLSDWTGRLVTVEAGYPVDQPVPSLGSSRIQQGLTPAGPAARVVLASSLLDHAWRHDQFAAELRSMGHRLTGVGWEVYGDDQVGGGATTTLYAQLLVPPGS